MTNSIDGDILVGIAFGDFLSPDSLPEYLCFGRYPVSFLGISTLSIRAWGSLTHPCRCAIRHLGLQLSFVLQLAV
jgi:hypothetical protein